MLVRYPTASLAIKSKFPRIILAASKNLSEDTPTSGLSAITAAPVSYTHLTLPTNREV